MLTGSPNPANRPIGHPSQCPRTNITRPGAPPPNPLAGPPKPQISPPKPTKSPSKLPSSPPSRAILPARQPPQCPCPASTTLVPRGRNAHHQGCLNVPRHPPKPLSQISPPRSGTCQITRKTAHAAPIRPRVPAPALLKLAEMGGNGRVFDKIASIPLVGSILCRTKSPETERCRMYPITLTRPDTDNPAGPIIP